MEFERTGEQDPVVRPMILLGEELSCDETDPDPTLAEEFEFQKRMDAIRDAERRAVVEDDDIILF